MKNIFFSLVLVSSTAAAATAEPPGVVLDNYISVGDNHWLGASLPIDSPASIEATFELFHRRGMEIWVVSTLYDRGSAAASFRDVSIWDTSSPFE